MNTRLHPLSLVIPAAIVASCLLNVSPAGLGADPSTPSLAQPILPVRTWTAPPHATYYIDSISGSDSYAGTSSQKAWKDFARVDSGTFAPGDKILLRRGDSWTGYLCPGGSGTPAAPIVLSAYGVGKDPAIDAQGKWMATVSLQNSEAWTIESLNIANNGPVPQPHLAGVSIAETDFGVARDIILNRLEVHNVSGSDVKAAGGGSGIICSCGGAKVPTRFDGLTIGNCSIVHTDRNGIDMSGNWTRNASWYPSLHVMIRNNHLSDIGGDGIVPIACDGAVVAHNTLIGGRMRAQDYAAGIWPWSCDNTTIEYNVVSGMKGTMDGEGYDSDYNCRHSLFQYNVSEHNQGGFMLICDDGSQSIPWNIGTQDTIIRDNVSIDDGDHTFHITGPCSNTLIANNVFYVGAGQSPEAVEGGNWGGPWPTRTTFANNIFYATGVEAFNMGGMENTTFIGNCFWGKFTGQPADPKAVLKNPDFSDPGGLSAADYRLLPGSPCWKAGVAHSHLGTRGFGGAPYTNPPSIGAFQSLATGRL